MTHEELLQTKSSTASTSGVRTGPGRASSRVVHSAREHFANGKVRDSFPAVLGLWRAFRC